MIGRAAERKKPVRSGYFPVQLQLIGSASRRRDEVVGGLVARGIKDAETRVYSDSVPKGLSSQELLRLFGVGEDWEVENGEGDSPKSDFEFLTRKVSSQTVVFLGDNEPSRRFGKVKQSITVTGSLEEALNIIASIMSREIFVES